MYQASIRNKKNHLKFNHERDDNYIINNEYEEYGYVQKMLGNCRVKLISNSGIESIGIIRGSLRKFNKRVLIEVGDIVVISKRDYQDSKVDIVHKYNQDQISNFISENKLSSIIINYYTNKKTDTKVEDTGEDNYIDFKNIDSESSDNDDESAKTNKEKVDNKFEFDSDDFEESD